MSSSNVNKKQCVGREKLVQDQTTMLLRVSSGLVFVLLLGVAGLIGTAPTVVAVAAAAAAELEEGEPLQEEEAKNEYDASLCNRPKLEEIISNNFITEDWSSILDDVTFQVHRNGQAQACGAVAFSTSAMRRELLSTLLNSRNCENDDEDETNYNAEVGKYELESFLTSFVANELLLNETTDSCGSEDDEEAELEGFYGFCDMGPLRTVLQPDSDDLVPTSSAGSLPCRFYTREGVRISSLQQLADLAKKVKDNNTQALQEECSAVDEATTDSCNNDASSAAVAPTSIHLYAVPAGRVFMFAPSFVGEKFEISHVMGGGNESNNKTIILEVLSVKPRVFDVYNFFSMEEAQGLIDKALAETSETYGLHRSTTGTASKNVYSKRTSENAWDTGGTISSDIKHRCMELLGFDTYYESHTDGLQILRYNETKAYVEHMDYLDNNAKEDYDYDSSGKGGNRFATMLLYMSDLEEGGETVFPAAPSPFVGDDDDAISPAMAIQQLRESGELDMVAQGSWEEQMIGTCRTRLATKPRTSRAVLFYSQYPNGVEDLSSKHGGCPPIKGTKWAANLWVWNAARAEFDTAPFKPGRERKPSPAFREIKASFQNTGADERYNDENVQLYYGDTTPFGNLGPGKTINVNTFATHVWNLKSSDGTILKSWEISGDNDEETFIL